MEKTRKSTKKPISNSPRVMEELRRIKAQKERRYNKLGEWINAGRPGFNIEVVDMRAVMR